MLPDMVIPAEQVAQEVAGTGGLDGLTRLTKAITAMEALRVELITGLRQQPDASWDEIGRACGMTRQGATRRWSRRAQASSFGASAERYERGRPEYPQSAIDWLIPRRARRVLDLGAGTGKLTRALVAAGMSVTAVEPSKRMRAVLAAAVPQADVMDGAAERIPLPSGSVDAVVVAQAWHWFDTEKAIPEIARVLVPGGTLSLVWNVRDESDPWVAALGQVMHQHTEQPMDTSPEIGGPFFAPERTEIRWQRTMDRAGILDLVASRSYVITLPPEQRQQLLDDVADHLGAHPDVDGPDEITLPYVTRCTRVKRAV